MLFDHHEDIKDISTISTSSSISNGLMSSPDYEYFDKVTFNYNHMSSIIFNSINMKIKKVIFNNPATIVIWDDNTKTVVKCGKGDTFDPEKGLAMAISKRVFGNKGSYYNIFKKYCDDYKNNPTIIEIWADHIKTVLKCDDCKK